MRTWSLLLFQNVIERGLFTVVVPGGTCALPTLRGSAVGGSGRRAAILRARKRGTIGASCPSVHERDAIFSRINRMCKRERRTCMRHQNGQTFHLKLCGCSRMELGQECRAPKRCRSCDATICLVASDFFVYSLARRPTCGHQPLLTILCALDVILQKFSNGQHRHAGAVGKHTWLEPPYPKFLEMSRLR